jgi:hypothetical protein
MFDSLIKSMLPPGFDLDKTIDDLKNAIATTVATVQRIEAKQDAILAQFKNRQDATVTPSIPESNLDHATRHYPAGNPTSAAPGDASAGPAGDSDRGGNPA